MNTLLRKTLPAILMMLAYCATYAFANQPIGTYGGVIYEVYPGDDFRAIVNQMQPGDELVFHEGEYRHSWYAATYGYGTLLYLPRSGQPDKPLVFRGYGKGEARPVFVNDQPGRNLCEVWGNNIEIRYMEFHPLIGRGVRIVGTPAAPRSNILVEKSVFRGSVANSIDANSNNSVYDGIYVLNNAFLGIKSTGLYIGVQNGTSLVTNFVFDGNYLDATQVSNPNIVGYGMELKLNVKGAVVTNNLIVNTQGPGVMLYGTSEASDGILEDANIMAYNIIAGSRNSPGILVGAGPSIVKNNLVLGSPGGGIRVYDYGSRGLMHNVFVSENTSAANDRYGFQKSTPSSYVPENIIITNNIAISKPGVPGYLGVPFDPSNLETMSDSELEALIDLLKTRILDDPDNMLRVLPHFNKLKHGPFSMHEVKILLRSVIQMLRFPPLPVR